jgi:hypothetical protein
MCVSVNTSEYYVCMSVNLNISGNTFVTYGKKIKKKAMYITTLLKLYNYIYTYIHTYIHIYIYYVCTYIFNNHIGTIKKDTIFVKVDKL